MDPAEVERSCINDAVAILISKLDDRAKLDILNENVDKVLKMEGLSRHSKRLNELILDLAREERKTKCEIEWSKETADQLKKIEANNQQLEQSQQNLMRDIVDPSLLDTY